MQTAISEYINPFLLEHFDKKNMRSLTTAEAEQAEMLRFSVLCEVEPMGVIDESSIATALESNKLPKNIELVYSNMKNEVSAELERSLTLDECRRIQTAIYAEHFGE
jgi:hypothetical protein